MIIYKSNEGTLQALQLQFPKISKKVLRFYMKKQTTEVKLIKTLNTLSNE